MKLYESNEKYRRIVVLDTQERGDLTDSLSTVVDCDRRSKPKSRMDNALMIYQISRDLAFA